MKTKILTLSTIILWMSGFAILHAEDDDIVRSTGTTYIQESQKPDAYKKKKRESKKDYRARRVERIHVQQLRKVDMCKTQKSKQKYAGWYMRTMVKATASDGTVYEHNSAGVFGKLKQSSWKRDRHDIPAYGPAVFQVVFPHYNWEEDSGDYYSDYLKWNKKRVNKRAVWTFQIKNQHTVDLSNADIEIALKDAQNVDFIKKGKNITYIETDIDSEKKEILTLVDVDNHQTYSIDELKDAELTMDGKHTRTFRWVKGRVKNRDFKSVRKPE